MPNPKGNPDWKPGHKKKGGRKKGTPNKVNSDLKTMFLNVLDRMGGEDWLHKWAKESKLNQRLFLQMISKMLPSDVNMGGNLNITYQISNKFMPKDEKSK